MVKTQTIIRMAKRIKKDDSMYRDALSWMAYRYAIGITEYVGKSGQSEVERYMMFRDIEFDTEEFHALAGAFMDFLKRKKISDIVQLRDKYRENDLVWLSRNYAMGRHSYAASHCEDIVSYSDEVLSPRRKEFMGKDIRRELGDHLRWCSFFFDLPMGIERTYSPLDLFLQFITENDIDTEEKLLEFEHIQVAISSDGEVSYHTKKRDDTDKEKHYFSPMCYIDDYIGWDELASYFLPSCHKKCRIVFNGQESVVTYINSWARKWDGSGKMRYERVKVPIDKRLGVFRRTFLVEKYIVEDNLIESNNETEGV